MPPGYKSCVRKVAKKKGTNSAHAICTSQDAGGIKSHRKLEAKSKGKVLGN